MTFKITQPVSNRKVNLSLSGLKNQSIRGIRQGFYTIGTIARQEINKAVLKKPRAGQKYTRNGRIHTASRAGESFANETGTARRTRGFDTRGANFLEFGFRENGDTIYTKILEESTGSRFRPTVGNASRKVQGRAQNIMANEIAKAHKEGYK